MSFNVPLVNALSVNAKSAIRAVRDILEHIDTVLSEFDRDELNLYIRTYAHQQEIRQYMIDHGLCTFIANGSILPRESDTILPMKNAVPFTAPKEMEITIPLSDGIEMGIYDHIPGDGREYILTDSSALKIYAEDGRSVSGLDLSPFFKCLPGTTEVKCHSTVHASGSVSQAANIIEAVCGKCKLLLIDEDKSATNFMIRDKNMRLVVNNEPIIPFTDRVRELYCDKDVSTILVIGGSSEYLSYADTVILMEDYLPHIITEDIRKLDLPQVTHNESCANWAASRRLVPKETSNPFLYFRNVKTENEKKIILDEYSANITLLSALVSGDQLNTLACVMERLLTDKEVGDEELLEKVEAYTAQMLTGDDTTSLVPEAAQRFYEEIRPIDAFACVNRMRGLTFRTVDGH